ncbi:nodulation protein NolU [Mesorhizobium sp. WSM3224]|uniref:nodulation protein NolU n=1 Tax=Mesorhizobium sp. WSM3224 TaxID=1040986 RepID=UPI0032AEAB23
MSLSDVAALAHPSRLAACLDPALSAATLVQLQKRPRLQPKLAELLLGSEMHANGSCMEPDLLGGRDPRRVALFAGSVWHARSLLKLVSKSHLTSLVDHIGADAHAFGIRHLAQAIANSLIADPKELAQQIDHDGHACLGAWLNDSTALERTRVLLRLPVGTAAENPAPEHSKASGQLLWLVLAHLETENLAI